jgi:hypothetical protein
MPLSFLFVLVTYVAVAAACLRANNSFSGGLINTFTLGIILFAGIMSWNYGRRRPFWLGFFIFFTSLHIVNFWRATDLLKWYTLADAMGKLIESEISSRPFNLEGIIRNQLWYSHLSNCFVATAFGFIGGLLTTNALGKDPDRAQLDTRANSDPEL